jgi:hypothetical protein
MPTETPSDPCLCRISESFGGEDYICRWCIARREKEELEGKKWRKEFNHVVVIRMNLLYWFRKKAKEHSGVTGDPYNYPQGLAIRFDKKKNAIEFMKGMPDCFKCSYKKTNQKIFKNVEY